MDPTWRKSYVNGVSPVLKFDEITFPEALDRTARRFPDHAALIFEGTSIPYAELQEKVAQFSSALVDRGLTPGTRVGIIIPNLVQTVVGIYAVLRAGGVVVMHSPRADDMLLEHQFKQAGIEMVICLDVLIPRILNLAKRTSLRTIISCHIRDYLPFLKKQLFPFFKKELHLSTPTGDRVVEFSDLLGGGVTGAVRKNDLNDTAFILFTSATTGKSKAVELSHSALTTNVQQVHAWFPSWLDGRETVVACLPFFHIFGLTCALNISMFYGYSAVLVPNPEPRAIVEAIHNHKATFIPVLPSIFNAMLSLPGLKKYDLKSLKGCFSGGAPMAKQTIKSFEDITGAQICEGYGLTESGPVTHINPFGGKAKPGSIGLPLPNTDAKLVDVKNSDREVTNPGEPGELCIKGPQVMTRYSNLPEETARTLRDGWLFTGDIAAVDEEGYFKIVDRKQDIIALESATIYPRDIDEVLFQHPCVHEACAVGVAGIDGRQMVKAYVSLKDGSSTAPHEIVEFCRTRLPQHMTPRSVIIMDELPKSMVGKILRKELRRLHVINSSKRLQQ